MFFLVPREEAHRRLNAVGLFHYGDYAPGSERWKRADGYEIGLSPEDNGDYEEEMIKAAERL